MSASDKFDLTIRGVGGHAAMPHLARDPVVCGAALVGALQTVVSRSTSPLDRLACSFSRHSDHPCSTVITHAAPFLG